MILVEVQVPVLNRRYDFELEREKEGLTGKTEKHCFYVWEQERILREDETLKQQGVRNGNILYLI